MYQKRMAVGKKPIGLFEIICLVIIIVSFVSLILLALNQFNPFLAVGISAAILFALFILYKKSLSFNKVMTRTTAVLFLILLIALVLRYKPHMYLYADVHDQAHYIIMSEMYARTGSTFITDPVALKINNSGLQDYYESQNIFQSGKHRNWGIHIQEKKRFDYEFRFYPLHPLWMSIFSRFFGDTNRVYSLVLFSLISIVAFFFIALELSGGSVGAAAITGLIFSISDQHIFFSKSPVSEIVYLAFISSSLYFLLRYYKDSTALKQNNLHLFLSAGLAGCIFFTRITSFTYAAFFYALAALTVFYMPKGRIKKDLLVYFTSILGLYALSLIYGRYYANFYFKEMFKQWLLPFLLGSNWQNIWPLAIIGLITFLFLLNYLNSKNLTIIRWPKEMFTLNRAQLMLATFFLIIIYVIYKSRQIDYTLGEALHLFLPVSFILLFFPALFILSKKNFESFALYLLLAILSFTILPVGTPTSQTYSRYILDTLAIIFLACSLFIWELIIKSRFKIIKIISILLLIVVILEFAYNLNQYEKIRNTDGIHDGFTKLLEPVTEKDLIIFEKNSFWPFRNVLEYYFHLNVFAVASLQDIPEKLTKYEQNYDKTYILTTQPEINPKNINVTLVSEANIVQTIFNDTRGPPSEVRDLSLNFYLYKLDI